MSIEDLKDYITSYSGKLPTYIRLQEDSSSEVHTIIICADQQTDQNTYTYGAYYGYIGGGEFDGGYYNSDLENAELTHISYDEISDFPEEEANILGLLMKRLWELVDDEDEVLELTETGNSFASQNGDFADGVLIANNFDGNDLIGINWELTLYFEEE